ncbi:pyridoxal-phosphate dependent enzyme [Salinilacihabitans rarus]|uniref:pyridoxal-phosphate dependent enzyme n=1 Tax=Salinilacihabitans rarus TaxID=2961596 RepID=UPI0020C836E0|nr:pyridoxal-phosphate dependent enzyme [Salinilacihabitans rarus]
MPSDLTCPECGIVYESGPDEPWRCNCGHALEFTERPHPNGDPLSLSQLDTHEGLWTFFEFLPIEKRVSFHEGFTPLVDAPEWDARFKLEYVFPTGSFKDRGATTTLSRALELGVEKVIEDSSGNAGAAIATYAARAGLEADIYVPADVKQSKLMAIQRAGARPVRVEGAREDVTAACADAVESGEGWYASHAWNPAFFAGTMTFAFEVAAQREWSVPDAVVLPLGHGTLFLGAYRGFSLLNEAGIVDGMPRLLGAQAAGYAPIVGALGGEATVEDGPNEIADGIQITEPARGTQILDALEATDGEVIALGPDPVESALDRLHRGGFYVEPTAAVAPAALRRYREEGVVDDDEDVVVPLTGSGLKTL